MNSIYVTRILTARSTGPEIRNEESPVSIGALLLGRPEKLADRRANLKGTLPEFGTALPLPQRELQVGLRRMTDNLVLSCRIQALRRADKDIELQILPLW